MSNPVITAGPFSKIWDLFASVKLTIVLLLSLAATSIIGTFTGKKAAGHASVSTRFITFFMSHQQICLELVGTGKNTQVIIAGTANKNKSGMQTRVIGIAQKLAKIDK